MSVSAFLQKTVARSSALTRLAVKVRNQCTMALGYRFSPDAAPGRAHQDDGEALFVRTVASTIHNSGLFIDGGANRGAWTKIALAAAPTARVLAFEPSRSAAAILQLRYGDNPSVEVIEAALSDQVGSIPFFEIPNADENSSLLTLTDVAPRTVPVTTLDREISARGYGRVDLVKIDVEGYDFHAIRGASQALQERRIRFVQFEYGPAWARAGSTLTACEALMRSMGYEVLLIRPEGLFTFPFAKYGEYFRYSNFAAIGPGEIDHVRPILRGTI